MKHSERKKKGCLMLVTFMIVSNEVDSFSPSLSSKPLSFRQQNVSSLGLKKGDSTDDKNQILKWDDVKNTLATVGVSLALLLGSTASYAASESANYDGFAEYAKGM